MVTKNISKITYKDLIRNSLSPPDLLRQPGVAKFSGHVGQAGDDISHGPDALVAGLLVCGAEVLELLGLGPQGLYEVCDGREDRSRLGQGRPGLGLDLVVLRELLHEEGEAGHVGPGRVQADLTGGLGGRDLVEERLQSSEDGGQLTHDLSFVLEAVKTLELAAESVKVWLRGLHKTTARPDGLNGLPEIVEADVVPVEDLADDLTCSGLLSYASQSRYELVSLRPGL